MCKGGFKRPCRTIASTEVTPSRFDDPDRAPDGAATGGRVADPDRRREGERRGRPVGRYHLGGLDGLRAVAIAAVLLYHGTDWLPGGFLGVDLFFVISGFLITTLLLEELRATGTVSIRRFLIRRARRLLPALALVLVATLICSSLIWRDTLDEVQSGVVASAAYVMNWWLVLHDQSYFAATGRPSPLQHLWSLAIEEQFYLLWPPVVLFLGLRMGKSVRLGVAIVGIAGAIASAVWMTTLAVRGNVPFDTDASRIYYGTDAHASALLLACAAAAIFATTPRTRRLGRTRRRLNDTIGVTALAAFVWVLLTATEFDRGLYRGGFFAVAALAVVVVVTATRPGSVFGRTLDVAPMRWIGMRSYGIYLWHWPVFVVTRPVLDISASAEALLVPRLALTIGIAALSYRFLEQPIRREGFMPWLRRVTAAPPGPAGRRRVAVVIGSTVVGLALVVGLARPPLVGSTSKEPSFDASAVPVTPGKNAVPTTTGKKRIPRVTAFGDSVLASSGPALRQVFPFLTVDADVGRKANEVFEEIAWLKLGHRLAPIVVIETGANGIVEPDELDRVLGTLSDRRRVVLVTVHVPRAWQDPNNETFFDLAREHRNTTVADWHAAAQKHPEWLYSDGIHVRPEHAFQFAAIIKHAALDPLPAKK